MIRGRTLRGIFRQLGHVVEHVTVLLENRSFCVVLAQRPYQFDIQRRSTQKLCMRFGSIETSIDNRDSGINHFVLPARKRQVWRQ